MSTGRKRAPRLGWRRCWPRTIYQAMDFFLPRLEMYVGARTLEAIEAFLAGYEAALWGIGEGSREEPPWCTFPHWLAERRIGLRSRNRGWRWMIVEHAGRRDAAALFDRLVARFRRRRPVRIAATRLGLQLPRPRPGQAGYPHVVRVRQGRVIETPLPPPARMKVVRYSGDRGAYLFLYDRHGERSRLPEYHASFAQAVHRACAVYGVREEDWRERGR